MQPGRIDEEENLEGGFPGAVPCGDFVLDSLMSLLTFGVIKQLLPTGENSPLCCVLQLRLKL